MAPGSFSIGRMTSPSGFCMLEAILANSLFAEMPIELVRHSPTWLWISRLMFCASFCATAGSCCTPVEAAGDFINRHDVFDRNVLVDGLQDPVVVLDVELVMGLHQLHIRAEPPGFVHQRAGLDAERFRRIAGGDRAGGLRHRRHDDDRLAPQLRIFLLLARSEKAVEIKNEPAQQGGPPWPLAFME